MSNPGGILDEADKAYLGFLSAARESVTEAVDEELAEDYGWVKAPAFDVRGRPVRRRGVTRRPGLYFSDCTGCTR